MSHCPLVLRYEVWKIDTYPVKNNSYTVGREESWALKLDQKFEDLEEAKKHIIAKSMVFTDIHLFLQDMKSPEEREDFLYTFCFGEKYLRHQRYFLGKPDVKKLSSALQDNGVNVIFS